MNQTAHIGFISLGCPKATVDSEHILTQLRAEGYGITPRYDEADLVIINTCGFINEAIEESLEVIGEALAENGKVVVTGCLGANKTLVQTHYPDVLAVTGPAKLEEVLAIVHHHVPLAENPHVDLIPPGGIKLTPRHYAYVKIAEGCNQQCSFCIIPAMRGKLVSRPIGDILDEADALKSAGVQELLIIAQDTAAYGVDTKYHLDFWQGRPLKTQITTLANTLAELNMWIRLHYVYPYPHVDALVELMATGKILPYLDVPLQHGSPHILKAMRRPANTENMLQRIEKWRQTCPNLVLRSSFIVGFPGETDADFEALLTLIREARLDRVGAFVYSPVDGATANGFENPVPEEIKQARLEQLMQEQTRISQEKLQQRIGQTVEVLIDEITPDAIYTRSFGEAPEIDGTIILENNSENLQVGDFVDVEIFDADEHDLYAEILT